eukprot:scaffold260787_cov169-Cyclotella_meneghiniana.AAC.1
MIVMLNPPTVPQPHASSIINHQPAHVSCIMYHAFHIRPWLINSISHITPHRTPDASPSSPPAANANKKAMTDVMQWPNCSRNLPS